MADSVGAGVPSPPAARGEGRQGPQVECGGKRDASAFGGGGGGVRGRGGQQGGWGLSVWEKEGATDEETPRLRRQRGEQARDVGGSKPPLGEMRHPGR